ncbi:Uncharacterised protein [uncultured archaeon]|nr:Uncharacterised protein [uncultured archaeon]
MEFNPASTARVLELARADGQVAFHSAGIIHRSSGDVGILAYDRSWPDVHLAASKEGILGDIASDVQVPAGCHDFTSDVRVNGYLTTGDYKISCYGCVDVYGSSENGSAGYGSIDVDYAASGEHVVVHWRIDVHICPGESPQGSGSGRQNEDG